MTKQRALLFRKIGLLLILSGVALVSLALGLRLMDGGTMSPLWALFAIFTGTYLASLKTESEREEETNEKRARYSRIVQRFGAERVQFALKAAVVAILAFFPVALVTFLFDKMPLFWLSLVSIACLVSLAVITDNPDESIHARDSKSR